MWDSNLDRSRDFSDARGSIAVNTSASSSKRSGINTSRLAAPALDGAKLAFGEYANAVYHFDQAEVIVSLDADFLSAGPGATRYVK